MTDTRGGPGTHKGPVREVPGKTPECGYSRPALRGGNVRPAQVGLYTPAAPGEKMTRAKLVGGISSLSPHISKTLPLRHGGDIEIINEMRVTLDSACILYLEQVSALPGHRGSDVPFPVAGDLPCRAAQTRAGQK